MTQNQMIKISDSYQITNLITQLYQERALVTLWQYTLEHYRQEIEAQIVKYEPHKDELTFVPHLGAFHFNNRNFLYCFARDNSVVFKNHIYHNSDFKLIIKAPEEVLIKEHRFYPRTSFHKENVQVEYHLGQPTYSSTERFPFKSKLLDISQGGLAFQTRLENVIRYNVGDTITLRLIHESFRLVTGKISYIKKITTQRNAYPEHRVGIKFNQSNFFDH